MGSASGGSPPAPPRPNTERPPPPQPTGLAAPPAPTFPMAFPSPAGSAQRLGAPTVESIAIPVRRVGSPQSKLPAYQTALAAGMDLPAAIDGPLSIAPMARVLVPTGIAIALPPGFEAQVRPRSGLAWSRGLTVLNAPGTIDADYRGEIKVLLVNLGNDVAQIEPGERIAQLVVARHVRAELHVVESLDPTERGAGGYGSTGT